MQTVSLRRLMRRIALGLPLAIPVLTAPFNVGGCYPLGYTCPRVPAPTVVEYVSEPDAGPLDCEELCGSDVRCAATDSEHVQCEFVELMCPAAGRRPAGGMSCGEVPNDPTAAWLLQVAALEAASVVAFEELALDLVALDAPPSLIARAVGAREDEVRHAAVVSVLAARRTSLPVCVEVPRSARRTLLEVAEDNAREGCVREAWGAFEAAVQALAAPDQDVREAMAGIARDEARHARLSFDLEAWALPRLAAPARARVERAGREARTSLRRELAKRPGTEVLGLLPRDAALAAFDRLVA